MLAIVGNLKINEAIPDRVRYLVACIRSFEFMKDYCKFILNLETPSVKLVVLINNELKKAGFNYCLTQTHKPTNYGETYSHLLSFCNDGDYVLNLIEDQFSILDNALDIQILMLGMLAFDADILKTSFFQIEQNSAKTLNCIDDNDDFKVFANHSSNFLQYQKFYGSRYYIGVNFLTTLKFAKKFWGRKLNFTRPHEYEIVCYDETFLHRCLIPKQEILCAIDDAHGAPASHLLARNEPKWNRIWDKVKMMEI